MRIQTDTLAPTSEQPVRNTRSNRVRVWEASRTNALALSTISCCWLALTIVNDHARYNPAIV